MYLIIYSPDKLSYVAKLAPIDYKRSEDGECRLVDIANAENPKLYTKGKWESVEL